ncbi:uncharacterized protein C2orf81 homolog isoform X2 [Sminthopsis crassicaudata]|uniref:uncharacterized protein C2orf81 homolog isoform X2 n=1 Tax=Sminthopsis crassicaudata TaxID=9301 RepID=UPI003D689558
MAHEGSRTGRDRGQARAKAEKVRPPTVPVPQIEIVPGRLNESEWITLMGIEEGEDVVGDVLAELLARVMDATFKVYLAQQATEIGDQLTSRKKSWISVPEDQSVTLWGKPELKPTPGPPPTPEPSSQSPHHFVLPHPCADSAPNLSNYPSLDLSVWESSQFSFEIASPVSPHPSIDLSIWASPQVSLTSQAGHITTRSQSSQIPVHHTGGGDSSGQVEETVLPSPYYLSVPLPPFLASPSWNLPKLHSVPALSSLTPSLLPAASAKFMRLQKGRSYLASGLVYDKMGRIIAMDPLDPTHLPQHQIHPLAKVVVPEAEVHPLDSYKEQRKHVKYGNGFRFKLPGRHRPIPHFRGGFPFPSPGLPFPAPGIEFPLQSPLKRWSSIQWPYGLEGATDLLQMQPLHSEMGSGPSPRPELSLLPQYGPKVLEATSQLMWKPSLLLDTMKLKPHVSLWNPIKNTHRSGYPVPHMERDRFPGLLIKEPSEQQPIQTHALTPQVTVSQLLKGSSPRVRALPSQDTVSTSFTEES